MRTDQFPANQEVEQKMCCYGVGILVWTSFVNRKNLNVLPVLA